MKKGLALAAFVAAHNIFGGASPATAKELNSSDAPAVQQSEGIANYCDRQFTLIGDTNHDDLDIQKTIHSPQTADDMEACDIDMVFLEMDSNYQSYVDGISEGVLTADELINFIYPDHVEGENPQADIERELDVVKFTFIETLIKQKEIDVFPIDDQYAALQLKQESQQLKQQALETWCEKLSDDNNRAIEQAFTGQADEAAGDQAKAALIELQEREPEIFIEGWSLIQQSGEKQKEAIALRDDDTFLKSEIDKHMGAEDKAAVIFGAWHFANETGLTSLLGHENTRIVNIGQSSTENPFFKPDAVITPQVETPTPRSERSAPARSNDRRP